MVPTRLTVDMQHSPIAGDNASFLPRVTDSAAPTLGWQGASTLPPGVRAVVRQGAYRLVVATSPLLLPASPDVWDSGIVASSSSVGIPYSGPPLPARSRVYWAVATWDAVNTSCGFSAEVGAWEVPLLTDGDWQGAQWITRDAPHAPPTACEHYADDPSPLLRVPFSLQQPPASVIRARLYIAGLGYFTPYLDNAVVGDEVLAPGWTDFNTTVLYSTHDVTHAIAQSTAHVLGVALGNGWFNLAPLLFWGHLDIAAALPSGDPMTRVLLAIDYADGATQSVISTTASSAWAVGGGSLLFNSIYLGTRIDRRLEQVGWCSVGFDASSWAPPHAAVTTGLGLLRSQRAPPVRRQKPVSVTLLSSMPEEVVLDIGRQISGVCNFCFSGVATGAKIDVRYGELLYSNGSVNGMTSVAGQIKGGGGGDCAPKIAWQEDHYVFRGDAQGECWEPSFTWHAARYVQLTGDAAALSAIDAAHTVCSPLRSDVATIGSFTSSSPLLNSIHAAAVNTEECNLLSVQSDCPHRERLGYGGDALMSAESFMQTFDMASFYEKRLLDVVAAQRSNGGYSETSPWVGMSDAGLGGGSGPIGWQTYLPPAAMWLYKYAGMDDAIASVYASATRYVEFLDAADDSAIENGLGDWMSVEDKALPLTGLGFKHISYLEYANMSAVLGNASQAATYTARAGAVAAKINSLFLNAGTGVYASAGVFNATQCGQAMPLFLGIVPAGVRDKAVAVLTANLAAHGGNLQVGAFGVKYLLMALVDSGRGDLAWGVMNKTSFPSFGYMMDSAVNNLTSATTIWESWFTSDNTYSHNHPMFTSNVVWAYQGLAGIQAHPSARGFDRVNIKPAPPADLTLTSVNASIATVRGVVSSAWTVAPNGTLRITVCVPPNVEAELWLPGSRQRIAVGTCCGCVYFDQL